MLVKINLENEIFAKINELISKKRYPDLYRFIEIAINNQVQEEFSEVEPILADKILESRISISESERQKDEVISHFSDIMGKEWWQKKLNEIQLEESEIQPHTRYLIWSFYNRFLPVKIVLHALAVSMAKQGTAWIDLNQLKDQSYEFALEISKSLKEHEDKFEVPRNQRLSTGLPTPLSETTGLRGFQRRKKELKLLSSKIRFMEQFVGRKTSGDNPEFHGAGFSMGLIAVKFVNNICYVSLTENGKEFVLLNNPVIDNRQSDVAFFRDEVNFIVQNIIPRYTLEKIIMDKILEELKKGSLTSNEINRIFKEEKAKYLKNKKKRTIDIEIALEDKIIVQERVSTMGRLSELGLVDWKVDKNGQSVYSLKN